MSLDVYLHGARKQSVGSGIFIRDGGQTREITRAEWNEKYPDREPVVVDVITVSEGEETYSRNITHNLGGMADAAGIYDVLWRPGEHGIDTASQLIEPLREGLARLKANPDHFKTFNPPNGWGDYDGLVNFVEDYLRACEQYPSAVVSVSR